MLNLIKCLIYLYALSFFVSCAPSGKVAEVRKELSAYTACKELTGDIQTIQYIDTINGRRVLFNIERSSGTVIYGSDTQSCVLTSREEAEAIVKRFEGATVCLDREEPVTELPEFLVLSTTDDGFAAADPDNSTVQLVGQTFTEFQQEVDVYAQDYESLGQYAGTIPGSTDTTSCDGVGAEF